MTLVYCEDCKYSKPTDLFRRCGDNEKHELCCCDNKESTYYDSEFRGMVASVYCDFFVGK